MALDGFLKQLLDEGRVRVESCLDSSGRPRPISDREQQDAEIVLARIANLDRDELAGVPPDLDLSVALGAAVQFYRACSLLAHRKIPADAVTAILIDNGPTLQTAVAAYSVDLTFRFLPDLIRLAHAAAPDDPVTQSLRTWGARWPLSSVGVPELNITGSLEFLSHSCLRQLYVDRIIARRDRTRLGDATTRDALRGALGAYPALSPELAASLGTGTDA